MSKHLLSKSTFIRSQQCQKSLYLHKKRPFLRDKLSAVQLAKFRRGTGVGVLARELFPGGIDMSPRSPSQYEQKRNETAEALSNHEINVLYEAVFQFDDVLIMLDILVRDGDNWVAYEVKSSRSLSETYMKDAALQHYVLNGCNVKLSDFVLVYINSDYVFNYELDLNQLFIKRSVLTESELQAETIGHQITLSKLTLELSNSPQLSIGIHCNKPYPCDFIGHCWKNIPSNSILHLTTFDEDLRFKLINQGINTIDDLPKEMIQNECQQLQIEALTINEITYNANKIKVYLNSINSTLKKQGSVSLKLLVHRPAVPFIYLTQPYQLLPLALSIRNNDTNATESISFTLDLKGLEDFSKIMNTIFNENNLVITDDTDIIMETLFNVQSILSASFSFSPESAKEQLIGIHQLINEGQVFHPVLRNDWNMNDTILALTGKNNSLKEEVYLINDLLKADGNEETARILQRLATYPQAIFQLFEKIQQLQNMK
ncbi:MAG: hypothetical protein CVT92_00075 [Bacteroidetes bacterium HGW-Bacteroidetes-1]|jgi:hypothetical protein|nr:MAG: hypothetical protein CVT92_00075 [Bacteroidetes bacterium HGW-Bacteroidetes-1]